MNERGRLIVSGPGMLGEGRETMPAAIEQSAHLYRFSALLVNSRSLRERTILPMRCYLQCGTSAESIWSARRGRQQRAK